jgi:hypothetical protein
VNAAEARVSALISRVDDARRHWIRTMLDEAFGSHGHSHSRLAGGGAGGEEGAPEPSVSSRRPSHSSATQVRDEHGQQAGGGKDRVQRLATKSTQPVAAYLITSLLRLEAIKHLEDVLEKARAAHRDMELRMQAAMPWIVPTIQQTTSAGSGGAGTEVKHPVSGRLAAGAALGASGLPVALGQGPASSRGHGPRYSLLNGSQPAASVSVSISGGGGGSGSSGSLLTVPAGAVAGQAGQGGASGHERGHVRSGSSLAAVASSTSVSASPSPSALAHSLMPVPHHARVGSVSPRQPLQISAPVSSASPVGSPAAMTRALSVAPAGAAAAAAAAGTGSASAAGASPQAHHKQLDSVLASSGAGASASASGTAAVRESESPEELSARQAGAPSGQAHVAVFIPKSSSTAS